MDYTTKDDLSKLRVSDMLTLEDGSLHVAVKDEGINQSCLTCSIIGKGICQHFMCMSNYFHFKQIKP